MSVLQIKDVKKRYGKAPALSGVSFDVKKGEIVGLLGPNGSGKTTLIRIINTFITDYEGEILVMGGPLGVASKSAISYLPDTDYLRKDSRISASISTYADFFADFDKAKALEMLKLVKLEPEMKIGALSKGMREKLQLVLTMARKASLYIFDEPFAGVDPAARDFVLSTIISNYSQDGSILFATHLISDVEHLLTRVLFIKEGKIVLDADADEERERTGKSINNLFKEAFKC